MVSLKSSSSAEIEIKDIFEFRFPERFIVVSIFVNIRPISVILFKFSEIFV